MNRLWIALILASSPAFAQTQAHTIITCTSGSGAKLILDLSSFKADFVGSEAEPVEGNTLILGTTERFVSRGEGFWVRTYDLDQPFFLEAYIPSSSRLPREVELTRRRDNKKIISYRNCQ